MRELHFYVKYVIIRMSKKFGGTAMELTLLLIVVAYTLFFNGVMLGMVAQECVYHDKFFVEAWNEKVKESQDKKIGKVCMRTFYFIPQFIATVSKRRPAYEE